MTMAESKSQIKSTPDRASMMHIESVLALAERFSSLFGYNDPRNAFVLIDDLHSAGRISGARRIPIAELTVNGLRTVGTRRLQVTSSVTRYRRELKYLASMI